MPKPADFTAPAADATPGTADATPDTAETPRGTAETPRGTADATQGAVAKLSSTPGLRAWRNAIFVVFTLSGLAIATWVSRLPAVRDDLRLDTSQVGLLILGLSGGAVIGLIASQQLLSHLGPRRGIAFSMALVAVGIAGVGVTATFFPELALGMIFLAILGFGNGAADVMINVEGAAVERAVGRTLLPLMHAFFSFGTVAGAGIGAAASALDIPVAWHLGVMAVLIAVTGVVIVRYIPEHIDAKAAVDTPQAPLAVRMRENLSVWADTRLLLIGLIMLGMAFAEGSANDWLAIATVDGHHQSNTTGALVFGVFVAAMTLGRVAGGPLLDRFGRVPILRWSALFGAIGLLGFILAPSFWMAVVGAVLWGLGASLGFPVGMSAAADDPVKATARVSAVAMIGYLAFLAGPPLLGFLGQQFGILNALYVILALLILAALASPAARERSGRFVRP
ncbi:MFS transporter [Subtercola boreus]|uniref:MFS transporter n=1 Tax=Subtercola boreus TaxID=120213 RepID=A0A3E0WE20_9MICO|nr:MFS transporter [Subtercola boreus]RFA23468.1 MFS transporter [Subtercola boreus]RFA23861.1 MFS transporter [Subtercola boreus]RFA29562.1 MFS transporter [Subtercola boreus]